MVYEIKGFESDLVEKNGRTITEDYAIVGDKKIKISSSCDADCPPQDRMFNGRNCPNRLMCIAMNTNGRVLSKNDQRILAERDKLIERNSSSTVSEYAALIHN